MIKQRIIACFIVAAFLCSFATNSAMASEQISSDDEAQYMFSSVDDDGLNTSGIPKTRQKSGVISTIRTFISSSQAGYNYIIYAIGDYLSTNEFVKYLTSSWAYASSYTWSKSVTCQWTCTGDVTFGDKIRVTLGLSKSRTTTYATAVTLPADSTKYSKLAFGSDYFTQFYYVDRQYLDESGNLVNTYYQYESGRVVTPTEDTYLYVVYK